MCFSADSKVQTGTLSTVPVAFAPRQSQPERQSLLQSDHAHIVAVEPVVPADVGCDADDDVGAFVVGAAVGAFVGDVVGSLVGSAVGATVGALVGIAVGALVGIIVGAAVGATVGAAVGAAVGMPLSFSNSCAVVATFVMMSIHQDCCDEACASNSAGCPEWRSRMRVRSYPKDLYQYRCSGGAPVQQWSRCQLSSARLKCTACALAHNECHRPHCGGNSTAGLMQAEFIRPV